MRNCGREIIRNKKVKKNQIKVLTKLKINGTINDVLDFEERTKVH